MKITLEKHEDYILSIEPLDWCDRSIKKRWYFYSTDKVKEELRNHLDLQGQEIQFEMKGF